MQLFAIYLGMALICSLTALAPSLVADTKAPPPGITVRGAEPSDPSQQQHEETLTVKTAIKTIMTVQAPIEVSCQPMAGVAAHTYPISTTPQSESGKTSEKEIVLNMVDGKVYISCKPTSSK